MQTEYTNVLALFAIHFSAELWPLVQVLVTGAILARDQRTVTAILRVMGLSGEKHFVNYHRVLQRAHWSSHAVSQTLLRLLVTTFAPTGVVLIGGDETIERRCGRKIKAKGIYRDPVRSSHNHFVKARGLRWVTLMLLSLIPFAQRIWALPFLTVLAPSERFYAQRGRTHKKLTDVMRQALLQVRRWLPDRQLVFVADNSYAVIEFLWQMTQLANPITMVVRFRMDAALYAPAPLRRPKQNGRPRKKGNRLPTLLQVAAQTNTIWTKQVMRQWYGEVKRTIEFTSDTAVWFHCGQPPLPIRWVIVRAPFGRFKTQALLCTDLNAAPIQIIEWFIQRWQMEVTQREVREHLGVETQRQWSDLAILRTTPALFGLFSLVTVLAHRLAQRGKVLTRQTAWYAKPRPTFSDALAAVRLELWRQPTFQMSKNNQDVAKLPNAIFKRFAQALCYAS
ncbi:MAG TPA: transposase [Anaerolineae bacterium]|nr:transposase [Anaerolineae bacterium]